MFEQRHNILSNIRTNVRKYVVTWLEHYSREVMTVPGPILAELRISFRRRIQLDNRLNLKKIKNKKVFIKVNEIVCHTDPVSG